MPGPIRASLETLWPDWEDRLFHLQCRGKGWCRNTVGLLLRLVLLVGAVILLSAVTLFFAKGLWEVYLATPMGKSFADLSRQTTAIVSHLLSRNLPLLAVSLTTTSLTHLLVIGTAAKIVAAKRFFYDGRGIFFKLLWLAIGCGLTARAVGESYNLDLALAQLLCIVPCASLMGTSFAFASQIVPELDIVRLTKSLTELYSRVRMRKDLSRQGEG